MTFIRLDDSLRNNRSKGGPLSIINKETNRRFIQRFSFRLLKKQCKWTCHFVTDVTFYRKGKIPCMEGADAWVWAQLESTNLFFITFCELRNGSALLRQTSEITRGVCFDCMGRSKELLYRRPASAVMYSRDENSADFDAVLRSSQESHPGTGYE